VVGLLFGTTLALSVFGLVLIGSASTVRAEDVYGWAFHFAARQFCWLVAGAVAGVLIARRHYHIWRNPWVAAVLAVLTLAALTVVLGTRPVHGSRRWFQAGPLQMQPSELAKLALVILAAFWMDRHVERLRRFLWGFGIPAAVLGAVIALLYLEPDYGSMALVGTLGAVLMFVAGTRLVHILPFALPAAAAFAWLVMMNPVRRDRVLAFAYPERDPATAHQIEQAKASFISGGLTGCGGPGESIQKYYYLPEAHTDCILAIAGEELGFLAPAGVVAAFGLLLWCGTRIASRAPDRFGQLLAFGATFLLVSQAAINVGVVTGCLPAKGIALPFISYGGTSLIASCVTVGVLASVGRVAAQQEETIRTRLFKNALQQGV
jgi:cell division protein FtsW